MNKTIKELKEMEKIKEQFHKNWMEIKAGNPNFDWRILHEDIWSFIESAISRAREEERKEIRLRAEAIGTPDGYVRIDNLFPKTKRVSLKKILSTLSNKK